MAEAKGCASSGHRGSYTHKALPQRPQKCLFAGLVLAPSSSGLRTLARGYVLLSLNAQRGGLCSEVYGVPTTSRGLAADGAVAGLVRVGCRGVDAEAHPATLTRAAKSHRIPLPESNIGRALIVDVRAVCDAQQTSPRETLAVVRWVR